MIATVSIPQTWHACFGDLPLPPVDFVMRLYLHDVLQVWRNVPLQELMQCIADSFYGCPED